MEKAALHQLVGEPGRQTLADNLIRGCLNSKVMCSAINSSGGEVVGVAGLNYEFKQSNPKALQSFPMNCTAL